MDRDRLAAFVDGALSPEEAAAVVMHLADHPDDQAYVDDLVAANELLAAAYAAPLHEPVPEAIRAAIMGAPAALTEAAPAPAVLPFRPRQRAAAWIGGALALAAALAAVAVLMPAAPGPSAVQSLALGPVAAGSAFERALAASPALTPVMLPGGRELMVLATLRTADGRYCREIEIIDAEAGTLDIGLACTTGTGGWAVGIALQETLPGAEGAGFATASGTSAGVMGAFLDRIDAGQVLEPAAEGRAIESGWAP